MLVVYIGVLVVNDVRVGGVYGVRKRKYWDFKGVWEVGYSKR